MEFCYESINSSCLKHMRSHNAKVLMYFFMTITILFTICGNLLIIVSIVHFKQLHSPTNYLVLCLANVDLLLGAFVMPCSMVRSVETCWYFGEMFCKIHSSTDVMLSTASILHIFCISIDRFYAICHPLKYNVKMNNQIVLWLTLTTWGTSASLAFGMIFLELNIHGIEYFYYEHIYCVGGCTVFLNRASAFGSSLISFYIPGFIMVGIYWKIYTVAKRQAESIKCSQTGENNSNRKLQKREHKAAKTLGIVMCVFLICWFPFFLCNIVDPVLNYTIPPDIIDALVWFGYLNSALNPLIYAYFYSWFRNALRVIVSGKILQANSSMFRLYKDG
ncbi:trace amine-associated receptor 1-like [Ambystoma mexicanum]|uniref:trace amine-associated receptor 1-like n=1 Tax=Ambystoma mexicanum TaxID=8296 RepID=UPI0037E81559